MRPLTRNQINIILFGLIFLMKFDAMNFGLSNTTMWPSVYKSGLGQYYFLYTQHK